MTNPSATASKELHATATQTQDVTATPENVPAGTAHLPVVVTDPSTIADIVRANGGASVALVPTMGALHRGHLSLVRTARSMADVVVVSIFVNPLQFGVNEDLDSYPRDLTADLDTLAGLADYVFAPTVDAMYPSGAPVVTIDPGPVARMFEGQARPRLFAGALTVVAKLLNIVRPDIAVFGEKDAQQVFLITAMVRDLNLPVAIVAAPLVRDTDGLALSSRNAYLSAAERSSALAISAALAAAEDNRHMGLQATISAAQAVLVGEPGLDLDYLVAVDPDTFLPVGDEPHGDVRLIVAAQVGSTRLIDNQTLHVA